MKHRRSRLLTMGAAAGLAAGSLALIAPAHALAGTGASQACSDGQGYDDVPILTQPVTLSAEIGSPFTAAINHPGGDGSTYVTLCYSTTPTGATGSELTGGYVHAVLNPTQPSVTCVPDSNQQGVAVSCEAAATPTYSITPGTAGTGDTITLSIPFTVCVGTCTSGSPTLKPTGAIIGTLTKPQSPGGINADYALSELCVEVDGIALTNCATYITVGGVTTTGTSPLNVEAGGPCVLGLCLPLLGDSYIGTTSDQLATIYIPVTGQAIPVFGVHTCVYHTPSTNACPS